MKKLIVLGAVAALAIAMACGGGDNANPAAPSANSTATGGNLGPDGSTLKSTAPAPVSPANGGTLDAASGALVLKINAATAKFVQGEVFAYRFQLLKGTTVVEETRTSALQWAPSSALDPKTTYGWHARAEQGSAFGPWSDTWTFITPDQPEGYIHGGELYDPLVNGKTVGQVVGSVTFIPGQGVRINDLGSYIQYPLGQTVTGGEFSILVTGLATNTEGGKTKVMAMSQGLSDITTNDRRYTIEKRGDPAGAVAWRVITSTDQIDTVGAERRIVQFNPADTYLWKTKWGGNHFNLEILRGGAGGNTIYDFGKGYSGVYDPSPHYAFIGGPAGRGGLDSGSVPGMIIRQVWLSSRPRPGFANQ